MDTFRTAGLILVIASMAGCVGPRRADVGVRASGEIAPGVYGRIDVRNRPPPPLVYPQPVIIVQQPRHAAPVYMHVPPGHAKNWARYCHQYDACGVPVYFVKSREYEPGYRHPKKRKGDRDRDDDDDRDRRGGRR